MISSVGNQHYWFTTCCQADFTRLKRNFRKNRCAFFCLLSTFSITLVISFSHTCSENTQNIICIFNNIKKIIFKQASK